MPGACPRAAIATTLIVAAACGGPAAPGNAPSPGPDPTAAPAPSPAPLPPLPEPRIPRDWDARVVTARPYGFGGLAATGDGPVLYVADEGGGTLRLGTLAGDRWQLHGFEHGRSAIRGRLAARGAALALTWGDLDVATIRLDLRYRDVRTGADELVVGACSPSPHALVLEPDGPVIVHGCGDDLAIVERRGGAWTERARLPATYTLAAAASDDGDLHVVALAAGKPRHWTIRGGAATAHPLPDGFEELEALATCGGRVHALLIRHDLDSGEAHTFLARWHDGAWAIHDEPIPAVAAVLGFDEACRPFVADGGTVWSRAAAGWASSSIPVGGPTIKGLVGHGGSLHAAYEQIRNGVEVGIATALLVDE